jgi:hypothetical protein
VRGGGWRRRGEGERRGLQVPRSEHSVWCMVCSTVPAGGEAIVYIVRVSIVYAYSAVVQCMRTVAVPYLRCCAVSPPMV